MRMRACVVTPNFNGAAILPQCLDALERQTITDFEVIVVDDGSTDSSCALIERDWPHVRLIRQQENTGFAAACNAGVRAAKAPLVALLNNDAIPYPDWLEELIEPFDRDSSVFSASSLMLQYRNPELVDDAGDRFLLLGIPDQRGHGEPASGYARLCAVTTSCGGACAFRKDAYLELGGFEESFFAYMEDVDLGLRARLSGYKNVYCPKARVEHIGSATSDGIASDFKVRLSARNRQWLLLRVFSPGQRRLLSPFFELGRRKMRRDWTHAGFEQAYLQGWSEGQTLPHPGAAPPYARAARGAFFRLLLRMCTDTFACVVRRVGGKHSR